MSLKNIFLKKIDHSYLSYFLISLLIFLLIYFMNYTELNEFVAYDFEHRYKKNADIFLVDFKFSFLNLYLTYELIVSFLTILSEALLIDLNLLLDFTNMCLMSLSLANIFFLTNKKKLLIYLIFISIFLIYKANWQYVFFKLADTTFLFLISLFFLLAKSSFFDNKIKLILLVVLIQFTKPTGIIFTLLYLLVFFRLSSYKNLFFLLFFYFY